MKVHVKWMVGGSGGHSFAPSNSDLEYGEGTGQSEGLQLTDYPLGAC